MKKLVILSGFLLLIVIAVQAQDCATGYCPENITVQHKQGDISPFTQTTTYGVVESTFSGVTACWITRNLGATEQATSNTDTNNAARGWFWQFNRKQGYYHDGTTRTPSVVNWITSISENSDWLAENDPCTILLGSNWHIPTSTEWNNVITNGGWTGSAAAYSSPLKMHEAGLISNAGAVATSNGRYCSSTQTDNTQMNYLDIGASATVPIAYAKSYALSVRCIRTY